MKHLRHCEGCKLALRIAGIVWLIVLMYSLAHAQTDTCTNGDELIINTSTKRYQCLPHGVAPTGTGSSMIVANEGVTGTIVNRLAKLTGAPSTAIVTATSDTQDAIGIVNAGAGTTGSATITILGQASCDFDGATTAGNYFVISAITAGMCHDAGSTFPTSGATYGRVLSTNVGAGTYVVELMTPDIAFQNAGNGKSKPGGSNTQVQYNNNNQYGGITNATTDGTTLTLTSPKVITGINDTNGNELFKFTATGSAVDEFTITNAATANPASVDLAATGGDTNINVQVTPKGSGALVVNQSGNGRVDFGVSGSFDAGIQRVTANVVAPANGAGSAVGWIQNPGGSCFLAADQTNATITFANVTGCSISVTSGRKYAFKFVGFASDSVAADGVKVDFNGGTATATNFRVHCLVWDTALQLSSQATALATAISAATITGASLIQCEGVFEPSSTNTFIPRIAQNAHTTGTLTLSRGSFLRMWDTP